MRRLDAGMDPFLTGDGVRVCFSCLFVLHYGPFHFIRQYKCCLKLGCLELLLCFEKQVGECWFYGWLEGLFVLYDYVWGGVG